MVNSKTRETSALFSSSKLSAGRFLSLHRITWFTCAPSVEHRGFEVPHWTPVPGTQLLTCTNRVIVRARVRVRVRDRASSLCQGLRYYRTVALAKEPAKSRPGHCDLDSPQPINCQCEMPHYNYLFMIIFLSSVCYFERSRAKLAFMTFAS